MTNSKSSSACKCFILRGLVGFILCFVFAFLGVLLACVGQATCKAEDAALSGAVVGSQYSGFGSMGFYAIRMFIRNAGNKILSVTATEMSVQTCASRNSKTGKFILNLRNSQPKPASLDIEIKAVTSGASKPGVITLSGVTQDTDAIRHPHKVVPITNIMRT